MGQRRDDSRHRVALLGVHQNDLAVVPCGHPVPGIDHDGQPHFLQWRHDMRNRAVGQLATLENRPGRRGTDLHGSFSR